MSIKIECDDCGNEIKHEVHCAKCFDIIVARVDELEEELDAKDREIENLKEKLNDKL